MTIAEMKDRKREYGLTNEMLSDLSGVPLSTVQKIFSGATAAPRKATLDALQKVLLERGSADILRGADPAESGEASAGLLREAAVVYGAPQDADRKAEKPEHRNGEYTLEDYYALPEERRVELIDGVFYDMTAPYPIHQIILSELFLLFRACTDAHPELPCRVFFAPCDVRLDMDNRTMVQPDLFILCSSGQMIRQRIEGAPDLVLEILSRSTRKKDMFLKLHKYRNAGVREYWIVDPRDRKVLVYLFDGEDDFPTIYSFEDVIPIGISEGRCSIDFARVNAQLLPLEPYLNRDPDGDGGE